MRHAREAMAAVTGEGGGGDGGGGCGLARAAAKAVAWAAKVVGGDVVVGGDIGAGEGGGEGGGGDGRGECPLERTNVHSGVGCPLACLLSEGGGAGSGGDGSGDGGGEGGGGEGGTEEEPRWRGANAKSMSAAPTAWGRPTRRETDLWREQRNRDVSKATRRRRAQVRVFCECCSNHVVLRHGRCNCRRDARRMLRQRLVRWRPGVRLCSIARSCAP